MASSVPTLDSYLARITYEHTTKPKFVALVAELVRPLIDAQAFLRSLLTAFDIDTAIGVQLDAVGMWVGRSRFVVQPIANSFFSFDTVGLGFDQGVWKGPFDPVDGLVRLDDETYRQLLRAKVILNSWDGSIAQAAEVVALMLNDPDSIVTVLDNQDMTMTVGISGAVPGPLITAVLSRGYLPVNPEGVLTKYQITSINTVAIFGFDVENDAISGFDVGAWQGILGDGPSQVQNFSVASTTSTSVTLSWTAPQTGIGPITYQVQFVLGDGTTGIYQTAGPPTSSTTSTVSGLQSGTQYTFEVFAVNPSGPGPVSTPVTAVTVGIVPRAQAVVTLFPTQGGGTAIGGSGALGGQDPCSAVVQVMGLVLTASASVVAIGPGPGPGTASPFSADFSPAFGP